MRILWISMVVGWGVAATALLWIACDRAQRIDQGTVGKRLARAAEAAFTASNPALFVSKLHALRQAVMEEAEGRWPGMRTNLEATARQYRRILVEMAWPPAPPHAPLENLLGDWQPAGSGAGPRRWWTNGVQAALVYETTGGKWIYRVSEPWPPSNAVATDTAPTEDDAKAAADAVLREHVRRCAAFFGGGAASEVAS